MSTATAVSQSVALNGQTIASHGPASADATTVPARQVTRALCITAGVTVSLILTGFAGAFLSERQFAFSYLTAFAFAVSIAIGSLFWVMIHHLTSASWSVVVRRLFENQTATLPALGLLFVPLALVLPSLYGWMDTDANASDALWQTKRPY